MRKTKNALLTQRLCIFYLFCKKYFWFTNNFAIKCRCKNQISLKFIFNIRNSNTLFSMIKEMVYYPLGFRESIEARILPDTVLWPTQSPHLMSYWRRMPFCWTLFWYVQQNIAKINNRTDIPKTWLFFMQENGLKNPKWILC